MKKFSLIFLSMVFVSALTFVVFADVQADQDMVTGPGVGLVADQTVGKIYGYGSIITGTDTSAYQGAVAANAGEAAPNYHESNILNPIDYSTVDMGPTSNYYSGNYVEHSINDGGPGVGVASNVYGSPQVYGGGPGVGLAQNPQPEQGPTAIFGNVDPAQFLALYGMTPEQAAALFIASSAADKTK